MNSAKEKKALDMKSEEGEREKLSTILGDYFAWFVYSLISQYLFVYN